MQIGLTSILNSLGVALGVYAVHMSGSSGWDAHNVSPSSAIGLLRLLHTHHTTLPLAYRTRLTILTLQSRSARMVDSYFWSVPNEG